MADTQPDIIQADGEDSQKEENFSKISILDLQKKYEIGRDPLYARMRYLQIKTWKVSGKAYLYADQIAQMDALHDHIKTTGRMEGYPVPEPSGPVEEEQPTSSTLAVAETQQLSTTSNYAPKQKRSQSSQVDDTAAIVQSAQNKAAGTLIAENILARHFIENPELLPDNLKEQIKQSGEMPSIDPFAYADSLISAAMASISAA
ncbi:hypothetical protein [Nostoc sp. 'Lobaria pulmonaria (5183) cyanobiont']|uniref:hypothetical protein n=1 Tax=Nostoc sp. 'Lobaria pulmonaria (5183) cyanobiont' TaxID=1618022 RepID=UPI000D0BEDF9|nr:hypothetical protein [Nostoc sp. 'Lobaria pulmonaria (5183) cyanobiont']AVH74449.1 hypothetical protein NLP_30057 [Nostoc sp. 'Lobaria pulmonaria (5183) cyanobiont']